MLFRSKAAREAARRLRDQGVESVAVCLLFSFVNPAHEQRLAEIVREELPGTPLSLSHQVMPKAPEFERTSTTVVNAFVAPRVTRYLDRLDARLREAGYRRRLLVMQSSGGVMSSAAAVSHPVRTILSGPASGVNGAIFVGRAAGASDLITYDMEIGRAHV